MNIFEEYHAYLADNPKGYWFKRKLYGWGWTPAKWQGWALTIAYMVAVFGGINLAAYEGIPTDDLLWPFVGLTILFVAIVWKTGEPPKWQWGRRKQD